MSNPRVVISTRGGFGASVGGGVRSPRRPGQGIPGRAHNKESTELSSDRALRHYYSGLKA